MKKRKEDTFTTEVYEITEHPVIGYDDGQHKEYHLMLQVLPDNDKDIPLDWQDAPWPFVSRASGEVRISGVFDAPKMFPKGAKVKITMERL